MSIEITCASAIQTLSFFRSVILSGEPWTDECAKHYERATTGLQQLSDTLKKDPCALPPLDEELAWILGRPCFAVAQVARRLHALGLYRVEAKAEAEQAAALHWMLGLYLKHGSGWRSAAESILDGKTQG